MDYLGTIDDVTSDWRIRIRTAKDVYDVLDSVHTMVLDQVLEQDAEAGAKVLRVLETAMEALLE